jgi:hypothetical protein
LEGRGSEIYDKKSWYAYQSVQFLSSLLSGLGMVYDIVELASGLQGYICSTEMQWFFPTNRWRNSQKKQVFRCTVQLHRKDSLLSSNSLLRKKGNCFNSGLKVASMVILLWRRGITCEGNAITLKKLQGK